MNAEPPGAGDADRFLADLRADEAAAARRRERWLRRSFSEEATVAGILSGARGEVVTLVLRTGERVTGEVHDTGHDVVRLRTRNSTPTWVSLRSVAAVEAPEPIPGGEPVGDGRRLADVLTDLAEEATRVRLRLDGGAEVVGEVVTVGEVITLRDGPAGPVRYVPLDVVVWVLPST